MTIVDSQELPVVAGLRKAAVFLAQMTTDEAGKLLAHLRPREVERLTAELVRLGSVETEEVDDIMSELRALLQAGQAYGSRRSRTG
jgi:flagellar motor switch protein FliG